MSQIGFGKRRTLDEIQSWIAMGAHGSRITYFVGELCNTVPKAAFEPFAQQDELGQIRAVLFDAFGRNEIHLFQRRLYPAKDGVDFGFEYIAIKRNKQRYRKRDDKFSRVFRVIGKAKHAQTLAEIPYTSVSAIDQGPREDHSCALGRCAGN